MAEPLSIAAGVVGVLTAAAQISSLLIQFTRGVKNAPVQARSILQEVNDINSILLNLQIYLSGKDFTDRSRTSLVRVDHVVTIISGCVVTFAELERLLDNLKIENMSVLESLKWVSKESKLMALIQRLQNHKASLSLVLTILNGQTISEAKDSVDRLYDHVDTYYRAMSSRVHALETKELRMSYGSSRKSKKQPSIPHAPPRLSHQEYSISTVPAADRAQSGFWGELIRSRVYKKAARKRISNFSIDQISLTWSYLSGVSMADISDVSVINLVVTAEEVHNPQRVSQTWSNGRAQWPVQSTFQATNDADIDLVPTFVEQNEESFSCKACGEALEEGIVVKLGNTAPLRLQLPGS